MAGDTAALGDLQQERDFLLASLEDLEAERAAGDIDDADYQALRDDYTARAAAALKALSTPAIPGATATPEPATVSRASRSRRPVLVSAVVVAFALGAGALMARSSGERLPGKPLSGEIAATGPSDDLARARVLIGQGRTLDAIKVYDTVLDAEPENPEALTYRGWLVLLAGRQAANPEVAARGLASIERAIAADPAYPDSHLFRGRALFDTDPAGTVAELRTFLASGPPKQYVPMAQDTLRQALVKLQGALAPPPTP